MYAHERVQSTGQHGASEMALPVETSWRRKREEVPLERGDRLGRRRLVMVSGCTGETSWRVVEWRKVVRRARGGFRETLAESAWLLLPFFRLSASTANLSTATSKTNHLQATQQETSARARR
jgi:hypothetical protein